MRKLPAEVRRNLAREHHDLEWTITTTCKMPFLIKEIKILETVLNIDKLNLSIVHFTMQQPNFMLLESGGGRTDTREINQGDRIPHCASVKVHFRVMYSGVARISGQGGPKKSGGATSKFFPESIFSDDLPPPPPSPKKFRSVYHFRA